MLSLGPFTYNKFLELKEDKLAPKALSLGVDHVFMMAFDYDSDLGCDAWAAAVRVTETPRLHKSGIWVVGLTSLDDDMVPSQEQDKAYFDNEGSLVRTREFRMQDPNISDGYILSYDGFGEILLELTIALERELIGSR